MKKILSIITIIFVGLSITGCQSKEEKNDINNANVNKEVTDSVKDKETVQNLQFMDSNILGTSLGLYEEDVDDFMGKIPVYNMPEGTMYVAIKPKKGSEEKVKRALDLYVSGLESNLTQYNIDEATGEQTVVETDELKLLKDITKEEYKGYYIYVSGKEKTKIIDVLKSKIK